MQEKNLDAVFSFILNPKYRWLYHILFWLIIFSSDINSFLELGSTSCVFCTIKILLLELVIVYFNIYFLFSKYLVKGKVVKYTLLTTLSIIIYLTINYYLGYEETIYEEIDETTGEVTLVTLSLFSWIISYASRMFGIIGTAVGVKFFKQYFIEQRKLNAIKQDSLENELQYLKNQINPHFLFNSLNNIYVQSKKNLSSTSESILLLSDLLRYQLYDCAKNKVSLSDEIEYLQNFLKLENLRKKDSQITLNIKGITTGINIAPFIFMPFIENAIKYSGLTSKPYINIEFTIEGSKIIFKVTNNKADILAVNKNSGIGLNNVKRRLDLLYQNTHELIIKEDNHKFSLTLELETLQK
ncbi:sensor histidine kinase [Pseudofulvibacter geojedonensis]